MSPITYAIHVDQHLLKTPHQCSTCNQKYTSYLKYYTDDFCGDNAIPKNVKIYVNNTVSKLKFLEENTEIIGENFANHFTKYAKRATINEIPKDLKKLKRGTRFKKHKTAYLKDLNSYEMSLHIPETVEEWIINIPTMLDARVSLSVVDKETADTQLEQEFLWTYDDGETEKIVFEEISPKKQISHKNFCSTCKKSFATVSDLEQHAVVHKIKTEPSEEAPTSSGASEVANNSPRPKKMSLKLPSNVTTIICADCDMCSWDCDHSDHGIMLRRDSIADHVARTGHMRCRVAAEIRPQTDCKVRILRKIILGFLLN